MVAADERAGDRPQGLIGGAVAVPGAERPATPTWAVERAPR
jgi:hypothetical protein